jgi:hypothetical protein
MVDDSWSAFAAALIVAASCLFMEWRDRVNGRKRDWED